MEVICGRCGARVYVGTLTEQSRICPRCAARVMVDEHPATVGSVAVADRGFRHVSEDVRAMVGDRSTDHFEHDAT